ncbi:MAG: hypothetical protein ACFB0G_11405 [Leptolyngbyaceae cyanobacterium]
MTVLIGKAFFVNPPSRPALSATAYYSATTDIEIRRKAEADAAYFGWNLQNIAIAEKQEVQDAS